jgi:hypothetical protein
VTRWRVGLGAAASTIWHRQTALRWHCLAPFAITDHAGPDGQRGYRGRDFWETRRKIVAVPSEQPDPLLVAPVEDAEAVVLDLVNPAVVPRRRIRPSRKAGLEGDGGLNAAPLGVRRQGGGK